MMMEVGRIATETMRWAMEVFQGKFPQRERGVVSWTNQEEGGVAFSGGSECTQIRIHHKPGWRGVYYGWCKDYK